EGREGLRRWLEGRPAGGGVKLYIVDGSGRDLLQRHVPRPIRHMLRREQAPEPHVDLRPNTPGNVRPARPLPQLLAPDGDVLTFFAWPSRPPNNDWIEDKAIPLFLLIALVSSAAVSFLLARTMSQPVQKLRNATLAIAGGDLSTRVAGSLNKRRDELGQLAQDFDRMAEKLEQAAAQQSELSSNISHELRSPLARLRVALELARRQAGELPEFERIDQETERLDQLIGQILSYARLDAADPERALPESIGELLAEVVENVNYECRAAGGDGVRVELHSTVSAIIPVYRDALLSAVENVLRNAVAHSPSNGIVRVCLAKSGNGYQVTVDDEGQGVPASEIDKLFTPFYRTREAQQHSRNGSGLGLAIAARAIEMHGGSIAARNREQGGLQIVLWLPSSGRG
ncbi:MAG: HAMP domain-containing protein, partial [Halioglobus sp.]|nr:HAMP domain-containing protein [Halioglobus sp.]